MKPYRPTTVAMQGATRHRVLRVARVARPPLPAQASSSEPSSLSLSLSSSPPGSSSGSSSPSSCCGLAAGSHPAHDVLPGRAHSLCQCVLHLRAFTERGVLSEKRLLPEVYLVLEGPHEVSPEGFLHLDHAFPAVHVGALPQAKGVHNVHSETCQRV